MCRILVALLGGLAVPVVGPARAGAKTAEAGGMPSSYLVNSTRGLRLGRPREIYLIPPPISG